MSEFVLYYKLRTMDEIDRDVQDDFKLIRLKRRLKVLTEATRSARAWAVTGLIMLAIITSGCLLGCDGGAQAQKGLGQWTIIQATPAGLEFDASGTHEASMVWVRGSNLKLDPDGLLAPVASSGITEYLWFEPSSKVAGQAVLGVNEIQAQLFTAALSMAGQLAPMLRPAPVPAVAPPAVVEPPPP